MGGGTSKPQPPPQQDNSQDTRNSQSNGNQHRIVDQSRGAAVFQWNWASFGGGISSVIICVALILLLLYLLRKNRRTNRRARRSELHEMLLLTGRVVPGRSTRGPYQSGVYPPSSGYPGTALGHSGAPAGGWSEPPPPYSAVCPSCPGTAAAARQPASPAPTTAPAAATSPAVAASPIGNGGYGQSGLGLVLGPNGTVLQTVSGLPQLQGLPSVASGGHAGSSFQAIGGPVAYGASAFPAIAGPQQLQLLQCPPQRASRSSEWTTRIREVSPVRIREVSPVRTRVSYVDSRPREREYVPPSIIRTPRSDRRSVGTGISRSNSMRSVASEQETGIRGYVDRSSEGMEE